MIAFLLLGSNLGEREKNIKRALSFIDKIPNTLRLKTSSIYETEPWGYKDQPYFLNACCKIETNIPPKKLLFHLKNIEKLMGRKENIRYGPRIIDIDILLYEDLVICEENLTIPHPSLSNRKFALKALSEIGGECVHPIHKKTINELLSSKNLDKIKGGG